ncbi:hypothetical protein [Flammeovirga sp. EKP202]|uniref:hypothetical protein n=1 Tax=Flammeovirga sp. EKP202 TaxID=2770592 RepID=UPI00165F239A|nr:hypothetical protein [Flammeovirga sp. EKP202]MBD0399921.1 hypothetical protein [Flammeovirga sp. EKP202]
MDNSFLFSFFRMYDYFKKGYIYLFFLSLRPKKHTVSYFPNLNTTNTIALDITTTAMI